MRVLVAPDKFAGTLTAVEAAEAIAAGWRRYAPDDEVVLAPMSDGGPGFVDVLHASLGGDLLAVVAEAPQGHEVPATILKVGDTVYVESAQVCGVHLTGGTMGEFGTTVGVGRLLLEAVNAGATRVVVGLGGSGTNDGGAGLLAALGADADVSLDVGGIFLDGVTRVDLSIARGLIDGVEIIAATDVDSPLTGLFGATRTFGAQKGLDEEAQILLDGFLEQFAAATDRRVSLEPGAGAAGGLGFALMLLGGPGSRASSWSPRRWTSPGRRAPPTWSSPVRAPSTSAAGPARCRRAWRRSPRPPSGRAWRSRARSWSARARCARSAWTRRTPSSTRWGRSAPSATRRGRWPSSPHGWRGPGRAERFRQQVPPAARRDARTLAESLNPAHPSPEQWNVF